VRDFEKSKRQQHFYIDYGSSSSNDDDDDDDSIKMNMLSGICNSKNIIL